MTGAPDAPAASAPAAPGRARDVLYFLPHYLNDAVFGDATLVGRIAENLRLGKLVVIRHAFRDAFAERLHAGLDACTAWRLYEDDSREHFHYRHHNVYEEDRFPPDVTWFRAMVGSDATKAFMAQLSGRDCSGRPEFSPSWYQPGDHSLPHSDLVGLGTAACRQVACVWHLTKDWQPTWGGDLFWCPGGRYLAPEFNTLILFTISPASLHCVTPVSRRARSKRLAINGWWTGPSSLDAPPAVDRREIVGPLVEIV